MKNSFTRLFGMSEKEEVEEIQNQQEHFEQVKEIPVKEIIPNRFQPRTVFSQEKIEELAMTIRTHGMIQPIVIRSVDEERYEIIAGERRWRAVQEIGWETIPAIIKDYNDTETASVALIENLQREELTSIEEAMAFAQLIELHNLTQEALAQRLGKGQSTIANKLRLLKLPQEIQEALLQKQITERHARSLIPLKHPELQVKVLNEVIEKNLNVKQTEDRVEHVLNQDVEEKKAKPKRKSFSRDTRIAMNTIRQSLSMVSDSGISIDSKEEEFEEYIQLTIKIPK
ncbi:nucleoid occlusion protein [Bacillus carboniphilus]|uniref:Nucleoid occlusion protein n=1 Tax=Bacillus carboniphilus TaxID=86663 RepID=A0ABY9JTY2_9BACI|nr:nucleoid occlusion protein [Bacillus carboniphilus]WLR41882.1 nucleoid occlusion protein [Bacillus carboniphilus]